MRTFVTWLYVRVISDPTLHLILLALGIWASATYMPELPRCYDNSPVLIAVFGSPEGD